MHPQISVKHTSEKFETRSMIINWMQRHHMFFVGTLGQNVAATFVRLVKHQPPKVERIGRDDPGGWSPCENRINCVFNVFGFADLGLGFAGKCDSQNPRLQNPGFPGPDSLWTSTNYERLHH